MVRTGTARSRSAFGIDAVVVIVVIVVACTIAFATMVIGPVANDSTAVAAGGDPGAPPPVTVSDFYPEENNLSDCVGLVERPGCGSEERGGAGQTIVFVLLVIGLGIIFWRITVGVRRNRRE